MTLVLLFAACGDTSVALEGAPPLSGTPADAPWGTADWTVEEDGTGDFTSIQDAIDAATDGDWILVGPGSYGENLNYDGKSLWISSREGQETTTLDAQRGGYAVQASHGESSETGFVGFTVQNARDAAFYVELASLHIEDVTITDTSGSYTVFGSGADVELQDVVFENNTQSTAGIYMSRGSLQANAITIDCDRGSYAVYTGHGYAQIDQSTLTCGRGGYSFVSEHTTGTITRSWLVGNFSVTNEDDHPYDYVGLINSVLEGSMAVTYGGLLIRNSVVDGGGVAFSEFAEDPGTPQIESSVFLNSTCALNLTATTATVRNNAFWDTTASCTASVYVGVDGNLDDDPEMVDAASGDYHLTARSPLVDAGVDDSAYDDVDGSRNDIGLYGGKYNMDGGW